MLKGNVRKEYLEKRKRLSEKEWREGGFRIADRFSTLNLEGKQHLLSYSPLADHKEFDVILAENSLREQSPLVELALPRINATNISMEAVLIEKGAAFIKNKYNILEPVGGLIISPESIDILFVPLVACDLKGYRVGYGKGYYDRYLSRCRDTVMRVGFSYFEPVDRLDDIHEFDVPLNFCISPTRIYEF